MALIMKIARCSEELGYRFRTVDMLCGVDKEFGPMEVRQGWATRPRKSSHLPHDYSRAEADSRLHKLQQNRSGAQLARFHQSGASSLIHCHKIDVMFVETAVEQRRMKKKSTGQPTTQG